jgi:hypothetical protein
MLAAARPVLSPAAFVRAMGGGGGFIDAAEATARIIDVVSNFEKVRPADLLLARFCVFLGWEKIPSPPLFPFSTRRGCCCSIGAKRAVPEPLVAAIEGAGFFLRIASTNSSSSFFPPAICYLSIRPIRLLQRSPDGLSIRWTRRR